MEISGPFFLDDKTYSRDELMAYATHQAGSAGEPVWRASLFEFIRDFFDPRIPLRQKTSGTTGGPKILELNRDSMIRSAKMTLDHFNLEPGGRALLCLPVDYIAGKMMVVRALAGGLNLLPVEPSSRPLTGVSESISISALVPMQLYETLRHGDETNQIRKLLVGGSEINRKLVKMINTLESTEVYETFATTETYSHIAVRRISGNNPEIDFTTLKGVRISRDRRGCLVVDVPGITQGRVITNDLVEIPSEKSFRWMGRIDNVINSGGIKIIPELLEEKIRKALGIDSEFLVAGLPDPTLGEKLVLVVETKSPPDDLPVDQWLVELKKHLDRHEIPKSVFTLSHLPRNEAMKVVRREVIGLLD